VSTGQTLTYLKVDDPLPSGLETINQELNTSQQGLFKAPQLQLFAGSSDLASYLDRTDFRDDRVSLYASYLGPGTYTFSYLAQATISGHYAVAPTHASEAFFPEVFGRGAGQALTVGGS
jgi:uncharacterized protein YfaS (alpha-2-macroglobulin family)